MQTASLAHQQAVHEPYRAPGKAFGRVHSIFFPRLDQKDSELWEYVRGRVCKEKEYIQKMVAFGS